MFWSKNKDKDKLKGPQKQEPQADKEGHGRSLKSQALREKAMENARAARLAIGEETLDKIAAAMTAKQRSATEQAKEKIRQSDPDKVLDELLFTLRSKG